jgi:hypothetical protein
LRYALKQQRDRDAIAAIAAKIEEFDVHFAKKRAADQSAQEEKKVAVRAASKRIVWEWVMDVNWEQAGVPEMLEWTEYGREWEETETCA